MSQSGGNQSRSIQPETSIKPPVVLSLPMGSGVESVSVPQGVDIKLAFDTGNVSFARNENDLVISSSDGRILELPDFFKVGEGNELPNFIMADGEQVAVADFLGALGVDVTTAAGNTTTSNGLNSYDDSAADLIDGVDKLGSLLSSGFARSVPVSDKFTTGVGSPAGVDGGQPGLAPTNITYNARAVLYTKDYYGGSTAERPTDPADYKMHINFEGSAGASFAANSDNVSWELLVPEGEAKYFEFGGFTADGQLVIHLTQAGLDALAGLGPDERLYNYLKVTINGITYTVQLVAAPENAFDSENVSNDEGAGGTLAGSELALGEWHEGRGMESTKGTSNQLDTSGQGDSVIFHDGLQASGAGSVNRINTHTISGKTATVKLSAGLNQAAMAATDGGKNILDGSDGKDGSKAQGRTTVEIDGAIGLSASGEHSENTIKNIGDVKITATGYGLHAKGSGQNTLEEVKGNVGISGAIQGIRAEQGGDNLLQNIDGNLNIAGGYIGSWASSGGQNTISGVTGNATFQGRIYADGGINKIENVDQSVFLQGGTALGGGGLSAYGGGQNTIDVVGKGCNNHGQPG